MSSHIEIANLRGANAGLRQNIADRDDLISKLEGDIRSLETEVAVYRSALNRIACLSNMDSTVHSVASEALVQFHAD